MATSNYPFDDRFRLLVDEQSDWYGLINAGEPYPQIFEDYGYSNDLIRSYIKELKEKPIDELVALALIDDSDGSPALIVLQQRTSRDVFDKAIQLCEGENPKGRVLGVEVIMRQPGLNFKSEAAAIVCNMAQTETDFGVLEVLAYALSHLDVDDRSSYLKRMAAVPDSDTRQAVAYSLCLLEDDVAVKLLIDLSADEDDEVRNWATFGLHPRDKKLPDSPEIRNALFARVHDPHEEARHEALLGLAQYKDGRVVEPLIDALNAESVWELAVEAAEEIGRPELLSHLTKLRVWWDVNPELLDRAIAACTPVPDVTQ